jgi:hypothetical protein
MIEFDVDVTLRTCRLVYPAFSYSRCVLYVIGRIAERPQTIKKDVWKNTASTYDDNGYQSETTLPARS